LVKPEAPPEEENLLRRLHFRDSKTLLLAASFAMDSAWSVGQNPKAKAAQFYYEPEFLEDKLFM